MKLIICEKPSVSRAVAPVVGATDKKNGYTEGNGYFVSWCFGHLVGLKYPNDYCEKWAEKWSFSQLPMIPDTWKFRISENGRGQYDILKNLMNDKRVDEIICATDADREGECIFRYVYNLIGCQKPVRRLWVSSLEESAIRNALRNMKDLSEYNNLFQAGFCRAKADWLVGMNGSRLFSCRYRDRLNLGRVQTPTLAMIVKRDYDTEHFVKQRFFTVELNINGVTVSSDRIDSESMADSLVSVCNGGNAIISGVKKEIKTINPPKLYDLTTLQRDANKAFGYTAQQTLDFIQSLYEGKLATYPRTDSQYLSDDMKQTALNVVAAIGSVFDFGSVANPDISKCINNEKVTGHHAIIPTINIKNADISALPTGEQNILKLIANRLLCASAPAHKYESVKVSVKCGNADFTTSEKTILENGWKSYVMGKVSESENTLPELEQGQEFPAKAVKSEHFTSPPKPFTEDTLLSAMEHAGQENFDDDTEKKGLGTPATRAATIEGLVKNGYAERNGKQIVSTEKGKNLIAVVPDEVKSAKLTADWENKLKLVENGEYSAENFMNEIQNFIKEICEKYGSVDTSVKFSGSAESIGNCPKCGQPVINGKYGFYCSGKCGMTVAKLYGISLTENQIAGLLNGKQTSYTARGKKYAVLPEVVSKTEKAFASIADMKYNYKEPVAETPVIEESPIHFGLLGNGVTVYDTSRTNPETNDYVTVAHISPEGVLNVYDSNISDFDMQRIKNEAQLQRERFMQEWNSLSIDEQYFLLINRSDLSTQINISKEKLPTEEVINKYMPFVFFKEGERPEPELVMNIRTEEEKQSTLKNNLTRILGEEQADTFIPELMKAFENNPVSGAEDDPVKESEFKAALFDILEDEEQTEEVYSAFLESTNTYSSVARQNYDIIPQNGTYSIYQNQHFENPSDNIINNNKEKNNQTLLFHQETINQSAPEEKFSTEFSTVETVENSDGLMEKMDRMLKEMKIYTEVVKENIEYDDYAAWIQNYPRIFGKEHSMKVEELDEIVGMIVRTICSQSPCAEICGQVFPREVIKSTMLKVSRESLDRTLDIIRKAGEIHNYERYFISVLFNETNGKHFNPHTETANYEYEIRQMNRRYENY